MSKNPSNHQPAHTVSFVETQMEEFAVVLRRARSMVDRIPVATLRATLATVEVSMQKQATYEQAAGHDWLSPRYFELADEVNELRGQLARVLAAAEKASKPGNELIIVEYMAAGREMIVNAKAVLADIRTRQPCKTNARQIFDSILPVIQQARWFAETEEYAGSADLLEALAVDLEALREEARQLIR